MPGTEPRPYCSRPGCSNRLRGKQRKFCSNSCRATFSSQQKRADQRALSESIALEEIRESITPVVRELLTDKVLAELKNLTELLPAAVETLKSNMTQTEDPDLAFKAAQLLLRYTMGNSSIAPPSLEQTPAPLEIHFGIPQQGDDTVTSGGIIDATEVEEPTPEKECMECNLWKPADEFVGNSDRCQSCHDAMLADIDRRFPGALPSVGA